MDPHRSERVAQSIRDELNELIGYELGDPRVGSVTVSAVHLSPGLRHVHVSLNLEGTAEEQAATLEALDHAKQFLRHQLSERLQLFKSPELHFGAALPAALGAKATQILKRIRSGRPRDEKKPTA